MQRDAYIEAVLAKCESLQESNFWPPEPKLRPRAWLNNFEDKHQLPATVLLDHFIYYSDRLTDRLLRAAVSPLAQAFVGRDKPINTTLSELEAFLKNAVFSPVEGEHPNPADSGNLMCRKIRTLFELPDSVIATPQQAVAHALTGQPVVLVDDFVGSGDQILKHWGRDYDHPAGPISLSTIHAAQAFPAAYICLAATSKGLSRVQAAGLPIRVCVAHEIGPEYDIRNLNNQNVLAWFPGIQTQIADFLHEWAPKLDLLAYMKTHDYAEYGYHSLGLTLGFEHSPCPDATLPIYWARTADPAHIPLVVRHQ